MVECQLKGLSYNCDDKYFLGHNCKEQNIFMATSKDVAEEEIEVPPMEYIPPTYGTTPLADPPEVEPLISMHALMILFSP